MTDLLGAFSNLCVFDSAIAEQVFLARRKVGVDRPNGQRYRIVITEWTYQKLTEAMVLLERAVLAEAERSHDP